MTSPNIFNILLIWPIINVLIAIYKGLILIHIPYALGFSIIILTVLIRLVLYPLTSSQLKISKKMQELAPHLNRVKEIHKGDNKRIQAETMKLYKEHGLNPAAGCVPTLLQLPIIIGLYNVLSQVTSGNTTVLMAKINKILYIPSLHLTSPLNQNFFGLPLGQSPSHLISHVGPLILLFPIATAVLQFIQSKMMFTPPAPAIVKKQESDTQKKEDDFSQIMQSQTMYIFPLMIGYFSFNFQLGLSLYWNTFTIFGIIQQYQIMGLGGLADLKKQIGNLLKRKN